MTLKQLLYIHCTSTCNHFSGRIISVQARLPYAALNIGDLLLCLMGVQDVDAARQRRISDWYHKIWNLYILRSMAEQRCSGSQSCVNHCKTWTFLDTISFHNYNKKWQRKAHLLVALYLGLCLTIAHLTRYCSPGIDDAVSRSVGYKMRRGSSQCPKGQMLNGMNIVAGEPPPPTVWVCLFVCNFLCSNLYKFARKNTFVCKSSLSMWEWWVMISCWLIYCIYFLKFACQRWVL